MLRIDEVQPMFTKILTTYNKYDEAQLLGNGIIDGSKVEGTIKEYQTVLAVGPNARVKVGDKVMINPARYVDVAHKHNKTSLRQYDTKEDVTNITYQFTVIKVKEQECLLLDDSDVMFVFKGEEVPDVIEQKEVKSPIIKPTKPKIIV